MNESVLAPAAAPSFRRPAIESSVQFLFFAILLLIEIQGLLLSNEKLYVTLFGRELSLVDGVIPVLIVLCGLLWIGRYDELRIFCRRSTPLWAFCGYLLASLFVKGMPGKGSVSLVQSSIEFGFLYLGFAVCFRSARRSVSAIGLTLRVMTVVAICIVIADVLYVSHNGFYADLPNDAERYNTSYGTYVQLGYFASLLMMFSGALFLWLPRGRTNWRVLALLSLSIVMLFITGARTPSGSGIAGLIVIWLLSPNKSRILKMWLIVPLILVMLVFTGVQNRFVQTESGSVGLNLDLTGRAGWYAADFYDALDHQPFGAGWGSSDLFVFQEEGEGEIATTHSQHLQLFHDLGIVGYATFLAGWGIMLRRYWLAARRAPLQSADRLVLALAAGFLIGFFISMITDSTWLASLYYGDFGFFWMGAALALLPDRAKKQP
jgi:hypothetical protein